MVIEAYLSFSAKLIRSGGIFFIRGADRIREMGPVGHSCS